jgi:hypothetical protein
MLLCAALLSNQAAAEMHLSSAAAAPGGKTAHTILEAKLLDVCAAAKPTLILISGDHVKAAPPVHARCQQHRVYGCLSW